MKRFFLSLLLLVCFVLLVTGGTPSSVQAQNNTMLSSLTLDLWPEYDRQEELLVILTSRLPADTILPTTIDIPIPAGATLHVVARITADGNLIDDIPFTNNGDSVTVTTPELAFVVEYYVPVTVNGATRSFTFTWQADDLDVTELIPRLQRPAYAQTWLTEPAAIRTDQRADGLQYGTLPSAAVPAGLPYTVTANYTLDPILPSTAGLSNAVPDLGLTTPPNTATEETDWLLIGGIVVVGVLLLVALWFVLTGRVTAGNGRPRKPKPNRPSPSKEPTAVRFCHQCGTGLQAGDKFCRNCGAAVKN